MMRWFCVSGTRSFTMRTSRRAVAEPGIADRPGMPLVESSSTLSVGSFSFASSRWFGRSGCATPNSCISCASTFGMAASAAVSVGVSGRTSV